ncbi:hypothetical protein HNR05_002185 [Leifsonia psychrotolerans]|uniref:DUF4244 domain-containing protein n=1 Tax=Glaciibacter psychrotolerans TaxID=670054 RepID=A0A7Z0EEW5_9MICO|nr:hypothetical protein [Leifsonia psychrotolerans]
MQRASAHTGAGQAAPEHAAVRLSTEDSEAALRGAAQLAADRTAGDSRTASRIARAWWERTGIRRVRRGDDAGAATAEYAVATMAAVGFAGLLIIILRGDEVRGILTELVRNALTVG